ncbi:hypothetical protein N7478_012023 [Penicillium angulare]|uniref:uncharacterized protein n=1 Tax=Penicillium angulare TaxID=116970 RepID=UPI00253FF6B3|nr:uncharacterized protein N7478_012023 [Penicillium angulare]KAJ5261428.1 hypothetical protein N7478_012023 [Penicillium angulare]
MTTVPAITRSGSRGSDHELSYASPLVIRMKGHNPDRESLERHNSKRRSGSLNDEDGKLGDDGRKRRSGGSSDDEGRLTHDNLHNEDLRVGGPYLCSIPTASIPVPTNHPKFRLTCLETDEGWELAMKIIKITDKYHLKQKGVKFSFMGRKSFINPEPEPCLTLYILAEREIVDDTWLECARELRALLIGNNLSSCSVEIADPLAFMPMNTYPVLQRDKVFWNWEPLLQELLRQLDLTAIRFIGCFRRGRSTTLLECSPTLLIVVDRSQDWRETREKVVSILKRWHLQMLAVEIVKDRRVYQARTGISTGLLEGILKNNGQTMATESIASSQIKDGIGTLGCFLDLKSPKSDDWRTFALTCWHVVVPPFDGLSPTDKELIAKWNKNGVLPGPNHTDTKRLLAVDHPTRLAYKEELPEMEEAITTTESLIAIALPTKNVLSSIQKQKHDLQAFRDCFQNGHQLLGAVFAASSFKQKACGLTKDVKSHPTSLDWALVRAMPNRQPSNKFDERPGTLPLRFAPSSILQSQEMHGATVSMHGYRSGRTNVVYNGLSVAYIEVEMVEGVITTDITLEYSVQGLNPNGEPFSVRGDSGAMVEYKKKIPTSKTPAITERWIVGMVFSGLEKENITNITRADILLDDIKENTGAADVRLFSPVGLL